MRINWNLSRPLTPTAHQRQSDLFPYILFHIAFATQKPLNKQFSVLLCLADFYQKYWLLLDFNFCTHFCVPFVSFLLLLWSKEERRKLISSPPDGESLLLLLLLAVWFGPKPKRMVMLCIILRCFNLYGFYSHFKATKEEKNSIMFNFFLISKQIFDGTTTGRQQCVAN